MDGFANCNRRLGRASFNRRPRSRGRPHRRLLFIRLSKFTSNLANMKLRAWSFESKENHRIEVPNSCNLQQLKDAITRIISPSSASSSSSMEVPNLLLSLNRKDQLSGDESLQSLGTSVDTHKPESSNLVGPIAASDQNRNFMEEEGSSKSCNPDETKIGETVDTTQSSGKTEDIEDMEVDDESLVGENSKFSVPSFLKKDMDSPNFSLLHRIVELHQPVDALEVTAAAARHDLRK